MSWPAGCCLQWFTVLVQGVDVYMDMLAPLLASAPCASTHLQLQVARLPLQGG